MNIASLAFLDVALKDYIFQQVLDVFTALIWYVHFITCEALLEHCFIFLTTETVKLSKNISVSIRRAGDYGRPFSDFLILRSAELRVAPQNSCRRIFLARLRECAGDVAGGGGHLRIPLSDSSNVWLHHNH